MERSFFENNKGIEIITSWNKQNKAMNHTNCCNYHNCIQSKMREGGRRQQSTQTNQHSTTIEHEADEWHPWIQSIYSQNTTLAEPLT